MLTPYNLHCQSISTNPMFQLCFLNIYARYPKEKCSLAKETCYLQVEELNEMYRPFKSTPEEYQGCRGSRPIFRGYPCSLWQLFHSLMVNAAIKGYNGTCFHHSRASFVRANSCIAWKSIRCRQKARFSESIRPRYFFKDFYKLERKVLDKRWIYAPRRKEVL